MVGAISPDDEIGESSHLGHGFDDQKNFNVVNYFEDAIYKVYYCGLCDTAFTAKSSVAKHLRNYHKYTKGEFFINEKEL